MLQKPAKHSKLMEITAVHVTQEIAIIQEIVKQEIQVVKLLAHNANVPLVGMDWQFKENVAIDFNDLCLFNNFKNLSQKMNI